MTDATDQTELKEAPKHEISSNILNLVICGYIRALQKDMQQEIADSIYQLCQEFYPRSPYMTVLNEENLQLTLCDISRNDTRLSSKEVISLNKGKKNNEFGGNIYCGICYKEEVEFKNENYNAIFKYGGQMKDIVSWGVQDCGLLLYPNDIIKKDFKTYYYKLASLPFENMSQYNDPVYSDIYGLIILGFNGKDAKIASLDVMKQLNDDTDHDTDDDTDDNDVKWNVDTLPGEIFSIDDIIHTPSYCLINDNEKDLFIINGSRGDDTDIRNKNTVIYNLETKEYKIINTKHKYASARSSLLYCNKKNRVYVAGGQGNVMQQKRVYFYDLVKGKYNTFNQDTSDPYVHPLLWTNDSGTVLNIAGVYVYHDVMKINHEWLDLREPYKWFDGWKQINNMRQLSKKIWQPNQFLHLTLVNCN